VFALDESASVGSSGFQLFREFAEQISSSLDIGLQRSLVGVILFSSDANIHFPVTQHTDATTLLPALNPGLPYGGGGNTNTIYGDLSDALYLLQTAGQPGGALGLRSGFQHVAIVVIDGESSHKLATISGASALYASGIYDQIYAVGVDGANMDELSAIASDPSLVFFTNTFNSGSIATLEQSVTQQLCSKL